MPDEPVPEAVGRLFAAGGRERRFTSGQLLVRRWSDPTDVLLILDGLAKVTMTAPSGRESVLEVRGPGSLVGELSVVIGRSRSADVVAVGAVIARSIPSSTFEAALREDVGVCGEVLGLVARRLVEASAHQHRLATADGLGRLCGVLLELADRLGRPVEGGVELAGRFSQQELADFAGVSRDAVVRALRTLRTAGVLATARQQVLILDHAALARLGSDQPSSHE